MRILERLFPSWLGTTEQKQEPKPETKADKPKAPPTGYVPSTAAEQMTKKQAPSSNAGAFTAAGKGPAKPGQTAAFGMLRQGVDSLETRLSRLREAPDLESALKLIPGFPELKKPARDRRAVATSESQKSQNQAMAEWAVGSSRDVLMRKFHALYLGEGKEGVELRMRIDDRYLSAGPNDDVFTTTADRRDFAVKSAAEVEKAIPGVTVARLAQAIEEMATGR